MVIPAQKATREQELWADFAAGSLEARAGLIDHYASLVRIIASRMYRTRRDDTVPFLDYVQYGSVGLLEAIDSFDAAREVAFASFSSRRIRGSILNGLARESEQSSQYRFWRQRSEQRVESLCTAVSVSADRASFSEIVVITAGLVVGALIDDYHESREPVDRNPANDPYAAAELKQLGLVVKRMIDELPENERRVVRGHYIDGHLFDDLAKELQLSKGRISQLHAQALLRIRQRIEFAPKLDRRL